MKKICLTIAGSDSSGGAGIQADIKSISANNSFAMSVITLLTAQNSWNIKNIKIVDLQMIQDQIDSLFEDYKIEAIKIGALGNEKVISLIIENIKKWKMKKIVLDPVMVAKSNIKLLDNKSINKLITLIDYVNVITPNIPEAKLLINSKENLTQEQILDKLINRFPNVNILLKGGHLLDKNVIDYFYESKTKKIRKYINKRINTINTHGTGCTLSSALASQWAAHNNLLQAVRNSIKYTYNVIKHNLDYGKKHGPLDHFAK